MKLTGPILGIGLTVVGILALIGLRLWASPLALAVTGRDGVNLVTFLSMPLVLLVVGAGIVLSIWGSDLELG